MAYVGSSQTPKDVKKTREGKPTKLVLRDSGVMCEGGGYCLITEFIDKDYLTRAIARTTLGPYHTLLSFGCKGCSPKIFADEVSDEGDRWTLRELQEIL